MLLILDLRCIFMDVDGLSIDVRWMLGRYMIDAPFPTSYIPFPIFPFHMCIVIYVYVSFRPSFAHFPLPMARPGGMRGAIEYGQPLAGSAVLKARSRKRQSLPEDPSREA